MATKPITKERFNHDGGKVLVSWGYPSPFGKFTTNSNTIIRDVSNDTGIPRNLLKAVIAAESSGDWENNKRPIRVGGKVIYPYTGVTYPSPILSEWERKVLTPEDLQGLMNPFPWGEYRQVATLANRLLDIAHRGNSWKRTISIYYTGSCNPSFPVQSSTTERYVSNVLNWWATLDDRDSGAWEAKVGWSTWKDLLERAEGNLDEANHKVSKLQAELKELQGKFERECKSAYTLGKLDASLKAQQVVPYPFLFQSDEIARLKEENQRLSNALRLQRDSVEHISTLNAKNFRERVEFKNQLEAERDAHKIALEKAKTEAVMQDRVKQKAILSEQDMFKGSRDYWKDLADRHLKRADNFQVEVNTLKAKLEQQERMARHWETMHDLAQRRADGLQKFKTEAAKDYKAFEDLLESLRRLTNYPPYVTGISGYVNAFWELRNNLETIIRLQQPTVYKVDAGGGLVNRAEADKRVTDFAAAMKPVFSSPPITHYPSLPTKTPFLDALRNEKADQCCVRTPSDQELALDLKRQVTELQCEVRKLNQKLEDARYWHNQDINRANRLEYERDKLLSRISELESKKPWWSR